jgi:hypothetical protein
MDKKDPKSEPHLEYIDYDKLPILKEEQMKDEFIITQIPRLNEIPKWEINFSTMIYFRCLNKQNPEKLKIVLPKIIPFLNKLSNSIRSGISKLSMILMGEVLNSFSIEKNEDINLIKEIVGIVLHGTFSTKAFLKNTANNILKINVIENSKYENFDFTIELIDLMRNEKTIISDTAYNVYENIIKKVKLDNINNDSWNNFFIRIEELYEKKRDIYTKKCLKILNFFFEKMGKDVLMNKLKELGKEEKINLYENWIKLGTKKNIQTKMSFKEFRKLKSVKVPPEEIILNENNENINRPMQENNIIINNNNINKENELNDDDII